jgi:hypothetical protein
MARTWVDFRSGGGGVALGMTLTGYFEDPQTIP